MRDNKITTQNLSIDDMMLKMMKEKPELIGILKEVTEKKETLSPQQKEKEKILQNAMHAFISTKGFDMQTSKDFQGFVDGGSDYGNLMVGNGKLKSMDLPALLKKSQTSRALDITRKLPEQLKTKNYKNIECLKKEGLLPEDITKEELDFITYRLHHDKNNLGETNFTRFRVSLKNSLEEIDKNFGK